MTIDPDLLAAIGLVLNWNLSDSFRKIFPGRVSLVVYRWFDCALVAFATVIVFLFAEIQDTGPMQASKPEFTLHLSIPLLIASAIFVLLGALSLASSFRSKTQEGLALLIPNWSRSTEYSPPTPPTLNAPPFAILCAPQWLGRGTC